MDTWATQIELDDDVKLLGRQLVRYKLCVLDVTPTSVAIGEFPRLILGQMFARGGCVVNVF